MGGDCGATPSLVLLSVLAEVDKDISYRDRLDRKRQCRVFEGSSTRIFKRGKITPAAQRISGVRRARWKKPHCQRNPPSRRPGVRFIVLSDLGHSGAAPFVAEAEEEAARGTRRQNVHRHCASHPQWPRI